MRAPLPLTAAEDLLEIVMRRYERASTLLTSNRPVEDWGKVLGDTAEVSSMLIELGETMAAETFVDFATTRSSLEYYVQCNKSVMNWNYCSDFLRGNFPGGLNNHEPFSRLDEPS